MLSVFAPGPFGRLFFAFVIAALLLAGCVADNQSRTRDEGEGDSALTDARPEGADTGLDAGPQTDATPAPQPRLVVEPDEAVNFGRVTEGTRSQPITLTLIAGGEPGARPLEFTSIGLRALSDDPQADFSVIWNNQNALLAREVLEDPDDDGIPGLASGGQTQLTISAVPHSDRPTVTRLLIETNGGDVSIPLQVNVDDADFCVEVEPSALNFGRVPRGRSLTEQVVVSNCGNAPITVVDTRLETGDGDFEVRSPVDDLPAEVAAGGGRAIRVGLTTRAAGVQQDRLLIEARAGEEIRTFNVPLSVLVPGDGCPVAVAEGRPSRTQPGQWVQLDASDSRDTEPEGAIIAYEWSIIQRPLGSATQVAEAISDEPPGPDDDPSTPGAAIRLDVPGQYILEARVTNAARCTETTVVVLEAGGDPGLRVELTWDTPGDPMPDDGLGTDLDLHLLHPMANNWFQEPFDCFGANSNPDWGELMEPADDPVLFADAQEGGPEIIELAAPQPGLRYQLGVHAFRTVDAAGVDYGPSTARLRVFYQDEVIVDELERFMAGADHFWCALQLTLNGENLRSVECDQYFEMRP